MQLILTQPALNYMDIKGQVVTNLNGPHPKAPDS